MNLAVGDMTRSNGHGRHEPQFSSSETLQSIIWYALSSSSMLILNKVAIHHVPLPSCVLWIQFLISVIFIYVCKFFGLLVADPLDRHRVFTFAPYACSFVLSVYCNGKVLQYLNVETLITFRSCSPLIVSVLEWLFLGRELPRGRSLASLLLVAGGALGYVLSDSEFQMRGLRAYGWVFIYLAGNCFEMTFGKIVLSRVKFEAPVWGSVLYTNTLALLPMGILALLSGEAARLPAVQLDSFGLRALVLSWSGWNCREKTTATTYTLLGVACKFISVLLNVMIWDKHATSVGLAWLMLCLCASSAYQQAPLREAPSSPKPKRANSQEHVELVGIGRASHSDTEA
ncbi:unnamed protein product [Polarella glacialis]|uniref:Sugar phosphate transporter domain-containing protein n=1 Tax=Polarella glacialis TaxID=89957 RepID=A0A813LTJ4_POLGL|nr:unnamed protein product [Polarella glacialis]